MSNWLYVLVLMSLAGLMVIQAFFINLGLQSEQARLDYLLQTALVDVKRKIDSETDFVQKLSNLLVVDEAYYALEKNSAYEEVNNELKHLILEALERQALKIDFQYAITDEFVNQVYLAPPDFERAGFEFNRFRLLLNDKVQAQCGCTRILHLQILNVYGYLARQLAHLILPSVLFLLFLITAFLLLIRLLRQQQQLDSIKNDFINNLTHELKTPVFSISLASKVIRELLLQAPAKANIHLDLVDKETAKLKENIDKVLELASLKSGNYHLNKTPVHIHQILQQLLDNFQMKVELRQGKLKIDLDATDDFILADTTHLSNTFQNILNNALQYSGGEIDIRVQTFNRNQKWGIEIADKGIGIAKEHQQKIFEKFYRVTNDNRHLTKGFGLGLSYAHHIVKAHQGNIKVTSAPENGTIFSILLPLIEVSPVN